MEIVKGWRNEGKEFGPVSSCDRIHGVLKTGRGRKLPTPEVNAAGSESGGIMVMDSHSAIVVGSRR